MPSDVTDVTVAPDVADTSVATDTSDTSVATDATVEPDADTSVGTDTTVEPDADATVDPDADTTVEPDVTTDPDADATVEPDADTTVEPDTSVDPCTLDKKGDGCACTNDTDCGSDLCATGPWGSYCTGTCTQDEDCEGGTGCVIAVGQSSGLCLVEEDFLCMPCNADADCRRAGGDATCVAQGITGSYCATTCANVADCPDGYACAGNKCVPPSGTCECSDIGVALQAATGCAATSTFGTCTGTRVCAGDGTLTACNAPVPKAEVCNGVNDDCDDQVDEVASACADGNPCTQDLCNGVAGCSNPPVSDASNTSCDDQDPCTGGDVCRAGVCKGQTDTCPCTPATIATDCTTPPAGKALECLNVSCNGSNVCVYADKPTGLCSDGSACTTGDTCQAGKCVASPRDCTDVDLCTIDTCDPATGCKNTPNTGTCEDGDPCTTGDTCATGACVGEALDCSDLDDACHLGVCNGAGGCFAQVLTCGVSGMRMHTPSAALSQKGTGATWVVGSVGHSAPVGMSQGTSHKVQFGFHPGMHR